MQHTFHEWIQNRKILVNEEHDPKPGDHVYFGIHDLMKNNFNLDRETMHQKMGTIADVDPVKERIKVSMDKDPYHLGYRKLESPTARKRKKMSKDGRTEVSIPHQDCKDISDMVGDGSKVWLVVDRGTKYQTGLNQKLNHFKYMNKGGDTSYMTGDNNMPQQNTAANPNMGFPDDPPMSTQQAPGSTANPAQVQQQMQQMKQMMAQAQHGSPQGPQGMQQNPQMGQGNPQTPMQPNPQMPQGMPPIRNMQLGNPNSRPQQNRPFMRRESYDPLASTGWKDNSKEDKFYKYY